MIEISHAKIAEVGEDQFRGGKCAVTLTQEFVDIVGGDAYYVVGVPHERIEIAVFVEIVHEEERKSGSSRDALSIGNRRLLSEGAIAIPKKNGQSQKARTEQRRIPGYSSSDYEVEFAIFVEIARGDGPNRAEGVDVELSRFRRAELPVSIVG